jgi:hypothetical protein
MKIGSNCCRKSRIARRSSGEIFAISFAVSMT